MRALFWCTLSVALCTSLLLQQGGAEGIAASRVSRAAITDDIRKWDDGIIYYTFDESVSPRLRNIIREAMNEWEDRTCVLFKFQKSPEEYPNFVDFYSYPNEEYCTCDSVANQGGKQLIKLGYICQEKGEVMHLLGHIIGFWHEQARPDRDNFVKINFNNVVEGQEANFEKLKHSLGTGEQGNVYDYGSIMNLKATAFSKNDSATTEVTNELEYERQGRPILGQHVKISEKDIENVNLYYSCTADKEPVKGRLRINIIDAQSLPITTDTRVEITLVKSNSAFKRVSTSKNNYNANATWNEHFEISIHSNASYQWQNFRLRLYSDKNNIEIPISMSETVRVVPGQHMSLKHCINQECTGFLQYNYEFISDGNECDPNPCHHGECVDKLSDYTCICQLGFDGKDCSDDVSGDSCDPNPCSVLGSEHCVDGVYDFTCKCKVGYIGKKCNIDVCSTHACKNGGMCVHLNNTRGYQCDCTPGYLGEDCETHVCTLNTQLCQNDGRCVRHLNNTRGYQCDCTPGYLGEDCETHVCTLNTQLCQNDGICVRHLNNTRGYQCDCTPGYLGEDCETHVCNSTTQPCQNDGICVRHLNNTRGYQCNCRPGYLGEDCETHVCNSTTQPCQNGGTCVPKNNSHGYQCSCRPGYIGENCESHVCSTQPCQNGGTCGHTSNSQGYRCYCRSGYQGTTCSDDVCRPNPCRNSGTCVHSSNYRGYQCSCRPGYQGTTCDDDLCWPNPCSNGGTCRRYRYYPGYTCDCRPGYQGTTCDDDLCRPNPCRNGGTCRRYSNYRGYTCDCRPGYQGTTCNIDVCSNSPCRNSGRCVRSSNSRGYTCDCGRQYSGTWCETDRCPCENGGTCSSYWSSSSYTCSCRSGYSGSRCQNVRRSLRIYAKYGSGLPDEDGWGAGHSDPYFIATAYDQDGNYRTRSTSHDHGTGSPTWYEWLDFGVGEWQRFMVQIYDEDVGSDDALSSTHTFYPSSGCHSSRRVNGYSGYVYFDYCFQ